MHVRLDEAGHDRLAARIDRAGVWTAQRADRGVIADRHDLAAGSRHRLGARPVRIHGDDASVLDDELDR
jgi:hypothetical protein